MAPNVYYLTAIYTCALVRLNRQSGRRDNIEMGDAALSVIVFSTSENDAQRLLENALREEGPGESAKAVTVRKFYSAPIVGKLLTESGNVPLEWPKILEKSDALLESTPMDDFEQGYWVDVDQVVPSSGISFSLGTLESNVPEDVRSGLNWATDKQFLFLLKTLPLPVPPPPPVYEQQIEDVQNEPAEEPGPEEIEALNADLPGTVAIVQARNAVAAAWLWRKYAENTQWNNHAIRITPLCGTLGEPE